MNLNEEIRYGYRVTEQIKRVWQIQLKLVKRLLDVCKKHNLKIWAEGGTLLGAVRHHGFIPWDDDIDMMMLRDDYDKLISLADKEFTKPYFLQCAETEPGYVRGHAQLRMSNTTAILPQDIWQDFNQGIFIDIFVYDKLPEGRDSQNKVYSELESIRKILRKRNYGSLLSRNPLQYINSKFVVDKIGSYKALYNRMVDLITKCSQKSDTEIGAVLWNSNYFKDKSIALDLLQETLYLPFEDVEMPVPSGYDKILQCYYGDYMKPVKAPSMHGVVIFDTERPYEEVLIQIRNNASFKQKLKHLFSFKLAKD